MSKEYIGTFNLTDHNDIYGSGEDGVSITGVVNWYLAHPNSTGVTTSTSGWTTAIQTPTSFKKYLWNYEVISYSSGDSTTTDPIIIGNYASDGSPGPPGEAAYSVIIESSNGYIFRNGQISTILSARIFRGDLEITNDINVVQFKWTRISDDPTGDQIWNDRYVGGTRTIILTDEDVFQRATFKCEIHSVNGG